jgi:sugar phosphate isomerase/epimerase
MAAALGAWLWPEFASASATSVPNLQFPSKARDRIAIASYPFREFIAGADHKSGNPTIELKDFAAHVVARFNINKIEPWSGHFPSVDPTYLERFQAAVEKAGSRIVNIAADGEHSPYAADGAEREKSIGFAKQWVNTAAALGSPSIRLNIPTAEDSKPNLERTTDSLLRVVEHASAKNVVINLENDNPISEDPFFLVKVIERVGSPWLHALPDFANTLAHSTPERAYSGIDAMFRHAYCICHVKDGEASEQGRLFKVDMARTFGYLKERGYKGFCSMEWDRPGDPYRGTMELIEQTVHYLS